jgi:hypothetical protein
MSRTQSSAALATPARQLRSKRIRSEIGVATQASFLAATRATAASTSAIEVAATAAGGSGNFGEVMTLLGARWTRRIECARTMRWISPREGRAR